MVHLIRDAVQLVLGATGIKVTTPSPHDQVDRLDKVPFTYLARGMSVSEANKLVAKYCLVSKNIGLLIYKAGIQALTYLGSIEGLTIDDHKDHISVLHLVTDTYVNGAVGTILGKISASNPNLKQHISTDDRVRAILQTLTGHSLEMNSISSLKCVNFNVYIESSTDDDGDWAHILETVHATTYRHPLLGNGFHGVLWSCNTCHGVDHPSGLCPFTLVPGWIKASYNKPISEFYHSVAQEISHNSEAECTQQHKATCGRGFSPSRTRGTGR
jgi:hypothetical protein